MATILSETKKPLKLTPEMAAEWLRDYKYDENRPLGEDRIRDYVRAIEEDRWFGSTEITLATVGRETVMINGRHRCTAVERTNRAVPIWKHHVKCAGWEDVYKLYSVFDPKGGGRNTSDVIPTRYAEEHGLTKTQLRFLAQAATPIMGEFKRHGYRQNKRSAWESITFGLTYAAEGRTIFDTLSGAPSWMKKRLLAAPSLAIWLVLMREVPEETTDLLKRVALNTALKHGTAAHLLHTVFDKHWRRASDVEFPLKFAYCWNKHIDGELAERLYMAKDAAGALKPVPLNRTSYIIGE